MAVVLLPLLQTWDKFLCYILSKNFMACASFCLPVPSYGSLLSSSFTTVFNGVGSSFTMNKLKELTPYCCRIRSRNDAGEGEFSKPKTFYTKAQPPQVIKGKEA